jgi:NADP-dependent 3-hydroxy acid dehydrogenase YdfG
MPGPLVVITGASSGIGRAAAVAFAREGHALLLLSRQIEPLPELEGAAVQYGQVDVADYDAVGETVRETEVRFGPVELLVNNAGFADARDLKSADIATLHREIDTNLKGAINVIKAVLPGLSQRQSGTIVNVTSVSDRKTAPVAETYTATKYALRAISESLREAEGRNNVRVINIAPGYIRTNIHAGMGVSFDQYRELLGNPDFMSAQEVADIILWCCKLPQHICVRDLVVTPTRTTF